LAPTGGWAFAHLWYRAIVLSLEERQEEAIALIEDVLGESPRYASARLLLAACQAELGRTEEARASVSKTARHSPYLSADHLPPMLSAHPDPSAGAKRMLTLSKLWAEVTEGA
jgi:tetratricopeptide (TPR) repeat protein